MTQALHESVMTVPIYYGGKWQTPPALQFTDVHNPSTGEIIARTPHCEASVVDAAIKVAQSAFLEWSNTSVAARSAILFRYKALLEQHFNELSKLVTWENGMTLAEAQGDVRRGIEVVDFACGIGHLLKGEAVPEVAANIDAITMREPIGVCAGITPFNFPAMVPMWMYPLAIACGNTFILKPSEKVPLTANRLAELLAEAGLPDGVFNVVHGGKEVVDVLCTHPGIASVSFVGSSAVAKHVYVLGCLHGKACRQPVREERAARHARRRAGPHTARDHGVCVWLRGAALHGRVAADDGGRRRGRGA